MIKAKRLDVLLVEDSPTDVLLTEEALSETSRFRLKSSTRLAEALRLLSEHHFDVVLLDLGLPDSQGLQTLRRLRESHAKVAVIVLTGRDDEEMALQALQEGAEDYLVKNQADGWILRRAIPFAVERAQISERLQESEERFRLLVEGTKDNAIMMLDVSGFVLTWNTGAERILGYSAEEIIGRHFSCFFRPEDVATGLPEIALQESKATGQYIVEGWRVRKDGSHYWSNGTISPVYDTSGMVRGFAKITKDLTERKQAEERLAASERLLRELADAMPQIVWAAQPDGHSDYYNQRWFEYTGLPIDAVGEESWKAVVHPDDAQKAADTWAEALRTGQPLQTETRFRQSTSGIYRWHIVRALPIRNPADQIVRWIGTCTDIDDLKRAEQQLRERSDLAELAADIGAAFAAGDELGKTLHVCAESLVRHLGAAFARIWMLNEAEAVLELQASAGMYTHLDGPHGRIPVGQFKIGRIAHERKPYLSNTVGDDPHVSDKEWVRREGMVAFAGYPLLTDNRVAGVMAVFSRHPLTNFALQAMSSIADVLAIGIERSKSEQSLHSREELLRGAFDYTNLATAITDISKRFIRVNAAFSQLFGYTEDEMLTMSMADITHPEDLAASYAEREILLTGENKAIQIEMRYLCKDKHIIWGLTNVSLVRDAVGKPVSYVCQVHDIRERKRTEEGLRLRDRAIQAVSEGILITDASQPDYPIIFASPGFERITGYSASEAVGRGNGFLQGPETDKNSLAELQEAIQAGCHCSVELVNYRKDGTPFWNAISMSPVRNDQGELTHFVGVHADVTARRALEEQFRQAQKMEAIGRLAGGVAHDFNNLLTVINGYSDLIQSQLPQDSPVLGLVREIGEAGQRAASLTQQLLAFSRKQVLEPKVLNLNTVVNDTSRLLKRLIGEDIDLDTALNPSIGLVRADPGQIEQILINLSVNARDAMPQGGKLTIETANAELDESYVQAFQDLRPGSYVMMAIADTGTGMDEQTKSRIFEPFFTTKGVGKGTGLGLATVFGIVKQSGGHINVYSEPGYGATFKVYLPKVEDQVTASKTLRAHRQAPQGNETILLVEDEPALLALSRHILHKQGYKVLEATQGEKAIKIAEQHEGKIHLLVTDVVMPGMSGRQIAERITVQRPEIKVLYLSGYTNDAVVRHGVLQSDTAFLQKPYTPSTLAQKVREVLDQIDDSAGGGR